MSEQSDTERHQCRARWSDDHVSTQEGRRCRFMLEQRDDGNWYCPAHGQQTVPEYESDEKDDIYETEQATLLPDGGTTRQNLTELEPTEHGKTYECPNCGEPVTEHCDCPVCGWAEMCTEGWA